MGRQSKFIKSVGVASLLFSLSMIICGVFFLIFPGQSGRVICGLLGGIAFVFGLFKILNYILCVSSGVASRIDLFYGLLMTIAGCLVVYNGANLIKATTLVFGAVVLIQSAGRIYTAIQAKGNGFGSWLIVFVLAIVSAAIGLLLIINPWGSSKTIIRILGIAMMYTGIQSRISMKTAIRLVSKRVRNNNTITGEFRDKSE